MRKKLTEKEIRKTKKRQMERSKQIVRKEEKHEKDENIKRNLIKRRPVSAINEDLLENLN